jgi:hypothetical protein
MSITRNVSEVVRLATNKLSFMVCCVTFMLIGHVIPRQFHTFHAIKFHNQWTIVNPAYSLKSG